MNPEPKPNLFVTGATGFVGGALARALAADGYPLTALVRPGSDRFRLDGLEVTWVEGNITDPASLRGAIEAGDWVMHAAGMLGQAGVPEEAYHALHVGGTENVLAAAREAGAARVLHVSSPGVLGPIDGPPADETAPLAPSNPYERSKAAAEKVALRFASEGLPVVIVRPEFIYGPGDDHVWGLVQAVQRGIFFYIGRGRYECHPTYIEDAVQGMRLALEKGRPGEIYHITGPRPVTFRHFGETVAAALDVRPPWLQIPRPLAYAGAAVLEAAGSLAGFSPPLSRTGVAFFSENRRFSWSKARQELGYEPRFELEEGVEKWLMV